MRRWPERLAPAIPLLLCAAPLFAMVVKGWTSAVLFLGALLSGVLLASGKLPPALLPRDERRNLCAVIGALAAPLLAAFVSAALRRDGYLPQFDAPARMALAIPILLVVVRLRGDPVAPLKWTLPLALVIALGHHVYAGQPVHWPENRMTVGFADPLVFGYLCLAFALVCLVSITPHEWEEGRRWSVVLRVAGVLLGFYMSAKSGSRTGWVAVPVVVGVWAYTHWGRKHRWASLAVLAFACAVPAAAYLLFPFVHDRVDLAVREIVHYSWSGKAQDGSVGLRITFLRIGADLLMQHPWTGVGDTAHAPPTSLTAFSYATTTAAQTAFHSAFHNQIVSSGVRSGLWGLVAAAALLLVPLFVCARKLGSPSNARRVEAAMAFAFFTVIFVSSLSTEVVDLKYMASFYAVMTALLCGATLAPRPVAD